MISAVKTHARLAWLAMSRRKLVWICAALAFLPAVAAVALIAQGNGGRDLYDKLMELYFRFMVPFVPTLLLAPAVSDEVEGRTWTFLFARPAPRVSLLLGKWAAATTAGAAILAAALALAWGLCLTRLTTDFGPELLHFLRTELAAVLGVAAFGAVAAALGTAFVRHPLIAAILYLLVVEAWLGSQPVVLNVVAVSWHLRNVADLGQPSNFGPTAHIPAALSALLLLGLPPALLTLAGFKLKTAEWV
jgi:ABC-type transport system involved in multi-copper enzyme maturation permease subunit